MPSLRHQDPSLEGHHETIRNQVKSYVYESPKKEKAHREGELLQTHCTCELKRIVIAFGVDFADITFDFGFADDFNVELKAF